MHSAPRSKKPGGGFDPESLQKEIGEIEAQTAQPDFWQDKEKAGAALTRLKSLKRRFDPWVKLRADIDDLTEIWRLAVEEKDESLEAELRGNWESLDRQYGQLKVLELLSGENDASSAFLTIHSGAGGTEACDWVSMLYRLYTRWADRHGYSVDILDLLEGEGGIKSVTLQVNGPYGYGYLKAETGIHRL